MTGQIRHTSNLLFGLWMTSWLLHIPARNPGKQEQRQHDLESKAGQLEVLNLSAAFTTIDHYILLAHFSVVEEDSQGGTGWGPPV